MERMMQELEKMGINYEALERIREKAGVYVARVYAEQGNYIIKYFENEGDRREIRNYEILEHLNIPTLRIINTTECVILMEDVDESETYRLGIAQDLDDVEVAKKIATWYKKLHEQGNAFVKEQGTNMYDENDRLTEANIERIKAMTHTDDLPVWKLINDHFEKIKREVKKLERTLTYNDFYYTNLIVAKDKQSAFMYDYNLLGKGYAYADLRNVCSSLSEDAKKAFLNEYGEFNPHEKIIDEMATVLIGLAMACEKERFPKWAYESLEELKNNYEEKVQRVLNLPN